MDQQQQSVQEARVTGKPDQTYQYSLAQIEQNSQPSHKPVIQSVDGHGVQLQASEEQVQNSNYVGMPHQMFQESGEDTHQPLIHSPQENLQKEEMKMTNMPPTANQDPLSGDSQSIFSSQMLQRQNLAENRDYDEFTKFNQQFSNIEICSSQSPSIQQQKGSAPNTHAFQGYQQLPGSDSTINIQQPPHNLHYNSQKQILREAQFQQRVSAQAHINDGQQYVNPGKMSMNPQMFQQKAVVCQKSEMTPSMNDAKLFNQGIPNDVLSYQTEDDGLNQRNQNHNLLQNSQNTTIYQKNNQSDQINSSQRKMSDTLIYSNGNNKNVLLDENVNKLVDFQDPSTSESASNFNQQQQLSQINKLVDEDEDSYAQSESNSNLNQMHDQFQDVAISPQFDHRGQNTQKQMPYYNDPNILYHQNQQMRGMNDQQKMQAFQNHQMSNQNYSNELTNKLGGIPGNNNQIQMDKNIINLTQYDAQRMNNQNLINMQNQMQMNNRAFHELQAQQYQGHQMMQQMPQQRKPQGIQMHDGMMMPQNYHQMNHQLMDPMQPQISQGNHQELKYQGNELYEQNQQAQLNQNVLRTQHYQQFSGQQMQQPIMPPFNSQQDQYSKFLTKIEDQQKNVPLQSDMDHQSDYLSAQAHEYINHNKHSMGQQMLVRGGMNQHQMNKFEEDVFQSEQQQFRSTGLTKGYHYNQFGQDDQQQVMSADETQQLSHLMQKQMALEQKQCFNQYSAPQQHHNMLNQSPERHDMRGYQNQGYDNRSQNQFLYQQAETPPFNESFYPQNFSSQGMNQINYPQQKHQMTMNQKEFAQNKFGESAQYKPMSVTNSSAFQGSQNQQYQIREADQQCFNPNSKNHFNQIYYNQQSPNSLQQKKKVPQRDQAHSDKGGYPQTQNFADDEPINNLNINNLSSAKRDNRAFQNQSNQIQPKIGRTRRTGSSYVQGNKPMEIIPVKVDVQDIDHIDFDNMDDNHDQSSQGTSKNKSGYSSGSKQRKETSSKRSSNKRRSSNHNNDEFGKDQTDCTNSGLIDTDSGNKQHNSFNEQQSFTDSRGVGKGSRGANSHSSKSGHHSLANSNQSYDEFIQQIQHDIKKANRDPEKEFQVLDGHIIRLATKKVGSKFLQEHLGLAKQSLINKIIDQIDEHLPNLMTDNYGNYFCSELIKYLQVHQRIHFMKQIKGKKFIEISCNNRGTYTLQNIIYAVTQPEEFEIIKETLLENNNICYLAKDKEGHHMLEKIITTFKEKQRFYIFQEIMENFNELATDKNGLCVLKKLIQQTKDENSQKLVVAKILQNDKGLEYVQDAFGNFVVSEVLNQFSFTICKDIFSCMESNFVKLSQNKFASKFIEVCIDRAPVEIQNEIVAEFCESPDLNRVVQSQFGNFVLQNSIVCQKNPKQQGYCKTEQQRIKLINAIIMSIKEVTDYKVQTKWGQDILMKFIQRIQNEHEYNRLYEMLKGEMEIINHKQKLFKQQQHIQFESYQNNPQKLQGRKNANSQGHQFPSASFQPQYSEKGENNHISQGSAGHWSGSYQNRGNQFDHSQEGHYQKNATKWAQKGKNSKNKKGCNNQQYIQSQQRSYGGYKNQNSQVQQNQFKQIQGKPQTLKRDNIMFADSTVFTQDGHNGQFDGQFYPRHSSDEQNNDNMMNSTELNQVTGSSRNSGIRQNSIYNDPTMLNQDSSGGTSERAHKNQTDSADQQND